MLNWAIAHYGTDPNQLYWKRQLDGRVGRRDDRDADGKPASSPLCVLTFPIWRLDLFGSGSLLAGVGWSSTMPFKATVQPYRRPSAPIPPTR